MEAAVAAVSNSAQAQQQQQTYGGVPIPPPLVPGQDQHIEDSHHPLPPQRSTSASGGHTGGKEFHEKPPALKDLILRSIVKNMCSRVHNSCKKADFRT